MSQIPSQQPQSEQFSNRENSRAESNPPEDVPWYKEDNSPREKQSHSSPWSSTDNSYMTNDSGFVNMKSHDNSYTGSRESISRSHGTHGNSRQPSHPSSARSSQRNMYNSNGSTWKKSNEKTSGSSSNTSTPRSVTSVRSVPVSDRYIHRSYNAEQTSKTSSRDMQNGTEKFDARYRSAEDNSDPLYMNVGNLSDNSRSKHINDLKGKPIGFSTPNISPGGTSSPLSSPGMERYPRSPPLLDTSTKLKPLNRVPPLDLRNVNDSSSEEFVEVNKNSALSPKATKNGLRVLPLTTDDHQKKYSSKGTVLCKLISYVNGVVFLQHMYIHNLFLNFVYSNNK